MADQSQYWQQQPGGWAPQQPGGWQPQQPPAGAPGGEAVAPPPKTVTPLDPPVVYYNAKWRVPPLVVDTQEEADALDPTEWITNPPPQIGQSDYPKLYANINVLPRVVNDADEEKALSGDWREFNLSDALIKAAYAANTARAQKQSQRQG